MRYYVYLHKRKTDNIVFYVGKGTNSRHKDKNNRSKSWKDVVEKHGFYSEILKDNLEEKEAIELERHLFKHPDKTWELVNKSIPSLIKSISWQYFDSILKLDSESPSYLSWKVDRYGGHRKQQKIKRAGDYVGTVDSVYYCARIDYKLYSLHRIVYAIYNKIDVPSDLVIDHIDANPLNNNPNNLQMITQRENAVKMSKKTSNTSGYTGLSFDISQNRWVCQLTVNGKILTKTFLVKKYGSKEAAKQAAITFNTKLRRENGYPN